MGAGGPDETRRDRLSEREEYCRHLLLRDGTVPPTRRAADSLFTHSRMSASNAGWAGYKKAGWSRIRNTPGSKALLNNSAYFVSLMSLN